MSQTYLGIIVMLVSVFLPKVGLNIGNDELTATITTLATIAGGLWAFYGRYRLGGVNAAGLRV
jgi:hypothetical protein